MKWLELAPNPRPRPEPSGPFADSPIEWDVFVSYRSSNRHWAVALRDQLAEAGFKVFLDQFVLRPGLDLEESLELHLKRSGSGVLVLSKDVADSDWVKGERRKMQELRKSRAGTAFPFQYVIVRIDESAIPLRDQDVLYSDFSDGYEDGPRGPELIRLVHGLNGSQVSEAVVRTLLKLDLETTDLLHQVAAAADVSNMARVLELASSQSEAVRESPSIAIRAAQALISAKHEPSALDLIRSARERFPRSIRLQQLEALALRRLHRTDEAQLILAKLYVAGHRDPETMGIYAATWMARYIKSQNRADLERSRALYLDAFMASPSNEYVGINAAAKSALLDEIDLARELAGKVLALCRASADGSDFYKSLSLAEALVLVGSYADAERIYRKARIRHPSRIGDLGPTVDQLEALILALTISSEVATGLRTALCAG